MDSEPDSTPAASGDSAAGSAPARKASVEGWGVWGLGVDAHADSAPARREDQETVGPRFGSESPDYTRSDSAADVMQHVVALTAGLTDEERLAAAEGLLAGVMQGLDAHRLSDSNIIAVLGSLEGVGRLVDAGRVAVAAEIDDRCDRGLKRDSLAWKRGCTSGTDLICRVTRASYQEARRRAKLGQKTRTAHVVSAVLPPRFPAVAAALTAGEIGVDAAEAIVTGLGALGAWVGPDDILTAERALVNCATGRITAENEGLPHAGFAFAADLVRGQVAQWVARLDPDGIAPDAGSIREATSTFGFGNLRDGLYPLHGGVTPELRGVMDGVFNTFLSAHSSPPSFPSAAEQAELQARIDAGEVIPGADQLDGIDSRTGGEKRADILRGLFDAAARDAGTPKLGGAAPVVMVHINAADLKDRAGRVSVDHLFAADPKASGNNVGNSTGVGWADGVEAPLSASTVRQLICNGGYRTLILGEHGEVVTLTDPRRFFTPAQRKAIIGRDGGCVIPGCCSPPGFAELHHVVPWSQGGKTEINNGVALCWYHHHSIETSGWLIRILNGTVQVKAPLWLDSSGRWRNAGQHRAHATLSH